MRRLEPQAVRRGLLLVICMAVLSLAVPALGQTTTTQSGTTQAPAAQQQSTQRTDTTTTTTHAQTAAAGIDPIWFVIGGIALLAILLIVILAARGRSGGSHVHERTTVVRKECSTKRLTAKYAKRREKGIGSNLVQLD